LGGGGGGGFGLTTGGGGGGGGGGVYNSESYASADGATNEANEGNRELPASARKAINNIGDE